MIIEQTAAKIPNYAAEIDAIRQLLHKEMAEQGTVTVMAASGEGWEAHIRERYAEP